MSVYRRLVILALLLCSGAAVYGGQYVTLRHVSIDRCASAWFIKRFVDADAVFVFFNQGENPPAGTGFGFFGAAYFNHGPDCTFTDLVKKHRQTDPALQKMNAAVNDVMAWMQGAGAIPTRFDNHISDIYDQAKSDSAVLENIFPALDLLYLKCGGKRTAYLEPERKYYDLLELQLLRRVLNDKGKQRVDRLFEPGMAAKVRTSDSTLQKFFDIAPQTAAPPGKSRPVEDWIRVLNGEAATMNPESAGWLREALADGVQMEKIDDLFALPVKWTPEQQLSEKTFVFEKSLWAINF